MKMNCLILAASLLFAQASQTAAQGVDVRALSRQRGARAYQTGRNGSGSAYRRTVLQRTDAGYAEKKNGRLSSESADTLKKKDEKKDDQTAEFEKYIAEHPHVLPDIQEP